MRSIYQFREIIAKSFTAGTKAVDDIWALAARSGVRTITICRIMPHNIKFVPRIVARFLARLICRSQYKMAEWRIENGSVVLMQHPIRDPHSFVKDSDGRKFLQRLKTRKKVKVITIIHDIEELRPANVLASQPDAVRIDDVIKFSDVLIVHNMRMVEWFQNRGGPSRSLVALRIFDYLTEFEPKELAEGRYTDVFYVGSLSFPERSFLRDLKKIKCANWILYGPNYRGDECDAPNVEYRGVCQANEMPAHLTHGFGLVWDGESIEGCTGVGGEYMRDINPHKLSLFLASGIPVITWRSSYAADFILENEVGIAVDSLVELDKIFSELTEERYAVMRGNALRLGKELRSGYFFTKALSMALEVV